MYAWVFRVTLKGGREEGEKFLKENLIPSVSQAPGFVAGYWVNVAPDQGRSVVVFESEDAAKRAMEQGGPPPEEIVSVDSFEMGEVVGHA
jgi:hypothetical protein